MRKLDDIYYLMKIFHAELETEKRKNKIQKIKERNENILFPFSLSILASYYIIIDYINKLEPSSCPFYNYELRAIHLIYFLLGMTLFFILGKVLVVNLRLILESEKIANIDEVYLPLSFVISIFSLGIVATAFLFSIVFREDLFILFMYAATISVFVIIPLKLFPVLRSRFQTSRVSATLSRPPFMRVTAAGSDSSFFIKNDSSEVLKRENIEIEHSDLENFSIKMDQVEEIDRNRFRPLQDVEPKGRFTIPFTVEKERPGKVKEELLEITIKNIKIDQEISKIEISLMQITKNGQ